VIKYYDDLVQGSDEWHAARCGLITASEMKLIITPTFKPAKNDKERTHLFELLAQRISRYVEPKYIGEAMIRGHEDELFAKTAYNEHFGEITDCGFVTNDTWGFVIGCSPDGLVGDDGMIECKSRIQKYQIETICTRQIPEEHLAQMHTELLVTGRAWNDYVSYSGGLPMAVIRLHADEVIQQAIVDAASAFEARLQERWSEYEDALKSGAIKWCPTERVERGEMFI